MKTLEKLRARCAEGIGGSVVIWAGDGGNYKNLLNKSQAEGEREGNLQAALVLRSLGLASVKEFCRSDELQWIASCVRQG
jgi:hypothetical protein